MKDQVMKMNLNGTSQLGLLCAVATLAFGTGNIVAQGFPGIGGVPGFGGAGGAGGRGGNSTAVATAARVTAVADEHSNAVIVSGSEEQLAAIAKLIQQLDTNVEDLTELQVFHLINADPDEMATLLTSIFPDPTTSNQNNNTRGGATVFGGGFGGQGGFGGGRGGGAAAAANSDRSLKQGKVLAVADQRTGSVVVSAAKQLMPQIAAMVMQLDSSKAKKKRVKIYTVENGNVEEIGNALKSVYETQNTRSTTTTTGNNALQTRQTQSTQNQSTTPSFGGAGTGGGTRGN